MNQPPAHSLLRPDGSAIHVRHRAAAGSDRPGLLWLPGFRSDMGSTKALALDSSAEKSGRACTRFDYLGHGADAAPFETGTIGAWLADALLVIRAATDGPQVLVGSSMGGWIALLVARALAEAGEAGRIAGMVLIAPAVDFTETLMWPRLPDVARATILGEGVWPMPSAYDPRPVPLTRALFEDGRRWLLMGTTIRSHGPIHILQGMEDPDVPWRHATDLTEHLAADNVTLTLVKDGDHRLSRPQDIERMIRAVDELA